MNIAPVQTNFDMMVADEGGRHATPIPLTEQEQATATDTAWGGDGFGFDDALDMVNPLQHLPVVGTAYREMTGDTIAPAARILGGLLFGGPIGFVVAIASAIFEEAAGKSVGTALADLVTGEDEPVQVANADAEGTAAGAEEPAAGPIPAVNAAPVDQLALAQTAAAPAGGDLPALPAAAAAAGMPQLSPQAMEALMRSFNSAPQTAAAPAPVPAPATPRPVATRAPAVEDKPLPGIRPVALPTAPMPNLGAIERPTPLLKAPKTAAAEPAVDDRRQAAMDLHDQLRAYAAEKGVTVAQAPQTK